ncbi:MAG: phosphopyruvate hydratase [Thermoflexaceae bacterium]|nr:phosphopyruvate hydratase [Thermoflexaceae bacterium]
MNTLIREVKGRQILDSRGNPTVEAEVELYDGSVGRAAAPSGASTGKFEALELRDNDATHYGGKGVEKAAEIVSSVIRNAVRDKDASNVKNIDEIMIDLDGTTDKSRLGANSMLAVSIAVCRAVAKSQGIPLYKYIGGVSANRMPVPMSNILNGGCHSSNNIDIQEFMIMPVGACCFKEGIRWCSEVYHTLGKLLKERGLSTAVGDEGGYAPDLSGNEEAIEVIMEAVEKAGYQMGKDFYIALDAAASEWKAEKGYLLPKSGEYYTTEQLIDYWKGLCEKYPICSIEDPLDEEDWEGWKKVTVELGGKIQLVGDDLFVTNTKRLEHGIDNKCGNSILIKLNQIGTVSETIEAIRMAHEAGYTAIVSHRSGETEDTTIADLAVALNTGQIKTGAPCRSERTAKYNRLIRIEEELNGLSEYRNPFI